MRETTIRLSRKEAKNGCVKKVRDPVAGSLVSVRIPAGTKNGRRFDVMSSASGSTLHIKVKVKSVFGGIVKTFGILLLIGVIGSQIEERKAQQTPQKQTQTNTAAASRAYFPYADEHDYYHQLSDPEKQLYAAAYEACRRGESSFTYILDSEEYDEFQSLQSRFMEALMCDHPELIQVQGGHSWEAKSIFDSGRYSDSLTVNMTCFPYFSDPNQCMDAIIEVRDEARRITDAIMANNTDTYSRVLAAHDYLVEHVHFDKCRQKIYKEQDRAGDSSMVYTAYGPLMEGSAVCEGYAKAMKMLLDNMDIDCLYISSQGHAFNLVWIDGEPTYIDPCWDDMTRINEDGTLDVEDPEVQHEYFGLTSAEMTAVDKHALFKSPFALPECTSEALRYDRRMGQYAQVYDFETVCQIVTAQYDRGETLIEILFGSAEELSRAVEDLYGETARIWDIPCLEDRTLSHMCSDDTPVLSIFVK